MQTKKDHVYIKEPHNTVARAFTFWGTRLDHNLERLCEKVGERARHIGGKTTTAEVIKKFISIFLLSCLFILMDMIS